MNFQPNNVFSALASFFKEMQYHDLSRYFLREEPVLEKLIPLLEETLDERKSKIILFKDEQNTVLRKNYIIKFSKSEDDATGLPIILINDYPQNATPKDNPICDFILQYKRNEMRDLDYDKLIRTLK